MKNLLEESKAYFNRKKKGSANLKMRQLKVSCLGIERKTQKEKTNKSKDKWIDPEGTVVSSNKPIYSL